MLLNAHIIEIDTLQPFIFFSSHENLKKIIVGTIVVSDHGGVQQLQHGTQREISKKKISKKRRVRRIW